MKIRYEPGYCSLDGRHQRSGVYIDGVYSFTELATFSLPFDFLSKITKHYRIEFSGVTKNDILAWGGDERYIVPDEYAEDDGDNDNPYSWYHCDDWDHMIEFHQSYMKAQKTPS